MITDNNVGEPTDELKINEEEDITEENRKDEKMRLEALEQYERYLSGEISKTDYSMAIIGMLETHMKKKAGKKRRSIGGSAYVDEEDLVQDFAVQVLTYLDEYDPHIAGPYQYFESRLNNVSFKKLGPEIKDHYKSQMTKLNRIAKKAGYKDGLSDPLLTPDILATISNESINTCTNVMEINLRRTVSYEESVENGLVLQSNASPESFFINAERSEFVKEQLAKLTPLQLFFVQHTILASDKKRKLLDDDYVESRNPEEDEKIAREDMKWSLAEFKHYFEDPENLAKYEIYLPKIPKIDARFIKKTINSAILRLRDKADTIRYLGGVETPYEVLYQASEEEMDRAFEQKII